MRNKLVNDHRERMTQESIILGKRRRSNIKLIVQVQCFRIVRAIKKNFEAHKEKDEAEKRFRAASFKVYAMVRRLWARTGKIEDRLKRKIKFSLTIFGNMENELIWER